jgi:DNA-binding response OmpR family regulator
MELTGAGTPHEIVVVDDESTICALLQRGLNEDNFHVTALTRPEEAMDAILERRPCLVILDVHMPDLDGFELLKRIKKSAPETPVLVISGDPAPENRDEARRLGACDFLNKPVNWKYLRNIAYLSLFLKGGRS